MKSLRVLLCLFAVGAFMTACQKTAIDELTDAKVSVESDTETNVVIEYTSLEALNKLYEENGLVPFTLEELGITEVEYLAAQERINNKEIAQSRAECSSSINTTFQNDGDMNENGSVTGFDLVLARKVILGQAPATNASDDFGTISWSWNGSNDQISVFDIILVQRWLLGILC